MTQQCAHVAMIFTLSFSCAAAKHIVLMNPFTVPREKLDEFIKHWELVRDFLCEQPGYISSRLHYSGDPREDCQLINVEEWKSKADFKTAADKMSQHFRDNRIALPHNLQSKTELYQA